MGIEYAVEQLSLAVRALDPPAERLQRELAAAVAEVVALAFDTVAAHARGDVAAPAPTRP
jgi:hypothetical protein